MEFFDEITNESLHKVSLSLTMDEAAEFAGRLRRLKGVPTMSHHEFVIQSAGNKITVFVHPEDPLSI